MPGSVPFTWIYPRRVTRLGCSLQGLGNRATEAPKIIPGPGMEFFTPPLATHSHIVPAIPTATGTNSINGAQAASAGEIK